MNKTSNLLVLGATGQVGKLVARALRRSEANLASFVKANNDRNIDSVTASFSKEAVVYDDGQIMRGTDEIRQWIAGLFQKFQYVVTPTNVRGTTNGAVLTATIIGNFPGGTFPWTITVELWATKSRSW